MTIRDTFLFGLKTDNIKKLQGRKSINISVFVGFCALVRRNKDNNILFVTYKTKMEGVFEYGDGNKQMTLNTAEQLIREVANTPVLWNRYHNEYNNRSAMDSEWDRIAKIMNKDSK